MIIEITAHNDVGPLVMDDIMGFNLLKMIGFPTTKYGDILPEQMGAVERRVLEILKDEGLHIDLNTAASSYEKVIQESQMRRLSNVLSSMLVILYEAKLIDSPVTWRSS